jgi:hypothetical protein
MSEDTNTPADAPAANDAPREFSSEPWHVLIGMRMDGAKLLVGMAATPEIVLPPDNRPDKTNFAVYFSQWLDKHMPALQAMVATEYAQYMNLRRMTEPKPGASLGLVDPRGERLSTGTTQ